MAVAPLIAMKSTACESMEAVGMELDRRAHTYKNDIDETRWHLNVNHICREGDAAPLPLEEAVELQEDFWREVASKYGYERPLPKELRQKGYRSLEAYKQHEGTTRELKAEIAAHEERLECLRQREGEIEQEIERLQPAAETVTESARTLYTARKRLGGMGVLAPPSLPNLLRLPRMKGHPLWRVSLSFGGNCCAALIAKTLLLATTT